MKAGEGKYNYSFNARWTAKESQGEKKDKSHLSLGAGGREGEMHGSGEKDFLASPGWMSHPEPLLPSPCL